MNPSPHTVRTAAQAAAVQRTFARRGPLTATAVVLAAAVWALGAGQRAQAAEPTPSVQQGHAQGHEQGHAHGHAHGQGYGPGMHEPGGMGLLPSGRQLERLLDGVKATEAQRAQIQQITAKARTDVHALHADGKGLRDKTLALWTAPKLDAAEAEKLRQQMLTHHDRVSQRMQQTLLDVGQVLTPEQRAKAGELIRAQRDRMRDRRGDRVGEPAEPRMQNHGLRGRMAPAQSPVQAPPQAPAQPGMDR